MALKSFYTEASEVPENLKDLYTEAADGRFVLDVEDIDAHPKVSGVIRANKENAAKAKERLTKIEELEGRIGALPEDFDADEWERLKSGAKPDEQITALKEQHARAVEGLKAKHKADLDAVTAQVVERDGYIDGQTRRDALNAALDEAGFDPAHKPMLSKFLADQIKVRREGDGQRVAFADTDLGEVSPVEFVKDFAAKQGKAYLAKPSGPGAPGNNGAGQRGQAAGNFGGSKEERQQAIAAKYPELGR
ncbi:hypothetical protein CLH39_11895 [Alcaligenes faecalis]|uniref:hypothetical protein n=1 Tax=Alcaligenes faecalis TaxID=511 RepID=UPI0019314D9A|nr:hypothetical protein [Alcaligenes faecalis]QRF90891.1 hypothetical protein CLH39_11895 [Alcaligenes faecalis]